MSPSDAPTEAVPATRNDDVPAHRYDRALAQEIEARWQQRWDDEGTYRTPNPSGPLATGFDEVADRPKVFVLDMFPYPSGDGLHVGHPLGFIGTDVYARYLRMTGHNVLHTMGYDAFGLPAEQYAVQTGQHPRITTEANVANYRRQLHRLGLGHDPRRSVSTTDVVVLPVDAVDLPADLQLLVRHDGRSRPSDRGADRRVRGGHAGRSRRWRLVEARRRRAAARRRLVPARVPRRGAGELVPRPGHGAGQRGGDVATVAATAATSRCSSDR